MCAGDQCCPGFAGSWGDTFPCPSASSGFTGCVSNAKVTDCTSSGTVVTTTATTTTTTMTTTTITTSSSGTCKIGADVQCPGSGNMCAGDQCCPGFAGSGGGTFPCPSASSDFSGCVNNTKVTSCAPGAALRSNQSAVEAGASRVALKEGDLGSMQEACNFLVPCDPGYYCYGGWCYVKTR